MAVLNDGDFELDGFVFSGHRDTAVYVRTFSPGAAVTRAQDAVNPVGENMFFGRDHRTPGQWAFGLRINEGDFAGAIREFGILAASWQTTARTTPGAQSVLRYKRAGENRRVYGRARNLTPDLQYAYVAGIVDAEVAFDPSDCWHYADAPRSLALSLIPGNARGLIAPLIAPLTTIAGGTRQGVIEDAGGDGPAPYWVTFKGPITNPVARVSGQEIGLLATLAYDQSVTVDTRLMTARRNDGANMAGALTRRTRLIEARINPGPAEITFTGTDATGTSSCTVSWRPVFHGF